MDDFTPSGLHESKNEWAARLVTILTPHIIDGFRSILNESVQLCKENNEIDKYLMTFQNLIARIPKWSSTIVANETQRIIEQSGCSYLEDLVTCIHVIQLKILTTARVGQKQKKVDMNIMCLKEFIHNVYINSARQLYKNVYLFDTDVSPLQKQKNNREIEVIIQECILNTIRGSIPVESILRCYLDESTEEDISETVKEEDITPEPEPIIEPKVETKPLINNEQTVSPEVITDSKKPSISPSLSFNDVDQAIDTDKNEYNIEAPKTISRLEEISDVRHAARKAEEEEDDDEENDKIVISTENIKLNDLDVYTLGVPNVKLEPLKLNDIEVLT